MPGRQAWSKLFVACLTFDWTLAKFQIASGIQVELKCRLPEGWANAFYFCWARWKYCCFEMWVFMIIEYLPRTSRLFSAIEKLVQPKEGPVLTSFDPVHSPTAKDAEQPVHSVLSSSPSNTISSSTTSTPFSSTKRSSKRRTMLFSSSVSVCSASGFFSQS